MAATGMRIKVSTINFIPAPTWDENNATINASAEATSAPLMSPCQASCHQQVTAPTNPSPSPIRLMTSSVTAATTPARKVTLEPRRTLLDALRAIPDRQYDGPNAVSSSAFD